MAHPLDNPIWTALTGPHEGLAIGRGLARQYPRDIASFAAFDAPVREAYDDLARDLPEGCEAWLLRGEDIDVPDGWERSLARTVVQMVRETPIGGATAPAIAARIVPLTPADAPAMLALAQATKPGPFAIRTHAFGHYIGVFEGARLMAMAGERLRAPGFVEVSAVAVYPEARGQGLATAMIRHMCARADYAGETPFLHAFPDNPAIALYERLGFRLRRELRLNCLATRR